MGDGFGSELPVADKKSNEDFLALDGKIFKLDINELTEDVDDLMSFKVLKTISRDIFQTTCDLLYKPEFKQEASIYAVFIAFN